MDLSAADTPSGGGSRKNSVTCAATRRRVNSRAGLKIGAFECV